MQQIYCAVMPDRSVVHYNHNSQVVNLLSSPHDKYSILNKDIPCLNSMWAIIKSSWLHHIYTYNIKWYFMYYFCLYSQFDI